MHITKTMELNGLTLYYHNELATQEMYEEIFLDKIYDFQAKTERPVIIDAGSNIGIAMLFFKTKYPLAAITCFEPDPYAFAILQKNVILNKLKNVRLINAALSKNDGQVILHGEVYDFNNDQRGNSIVDVWGKQRDTCSKVLVNSVRLSNYINNKIDFLKMDIEGAEQEVLYEAQHKLNFIKEMKLEVHEMPNNVLTNNLSKISQLLIQNGYKLTIKQQDIVHLPKQVDLWVKNNDPQLSLLEAKRF